MGHPEVEAEGAAADEVHDNEHVPGAGVIDHVTDLDDVAVAAAGGEAAGLADEGMVVGGGAHPLEGHHVAGAEVLGLEHDAVPAFARHGELLVIVDGA